MWCVAKQEEVARSCQCVTPYIRARACVCVCVWERGEFAHEANTREGVGTEVQKGSDEDECECVHAWKRAVVRRENNKEVYSFLHTRGPRVGG